MPIEMTPGMHKATRAALYRYISALPESVRAKTRGTGRGHIVDKRTKQNLRWKAAIEAAPPAPTAGQE